MRRNDRRRTLPVVKLEKDLDEENIPAHVLPVLGAPYVSTLQQEEPEEKRVEDKTKPPKAIPSWLQLSADDLNSGVSSNAGGRVRHSVGLDVPGAVHTIRTPSKVVYNLCKKRVLFISGS